MPVSGTLRAVIFDMDGLLINSEPYWKRAEAEIFKKLGLDLSPRDNLPDTIGLRIDQVVALWFSAAKINEISIFDVSKQIINKVVEQIVQHHPLLHPLQ